MTEFPATVFHSVMADGKLQLDETGISFAYKQAMGQPLHYNWADISQVEMGISLTGKLKKEFVLHFYSQTEVRFSSKQAGEILKIIEQHVGRAKFTQAKSLLNFMASPFRGNH